MRNWKSYQYSYIRLNRNCSLKLLEKPYLFNSANDELYELDEQAFNFLKYCDGSSTLAELQVEIDFLDYLASEDLVEFSAQPFPRTVKVGVSLSKPSLRYLMVEVTLKCNLNCLHCYQRKHSQLELSWHSLRNILQEFEDRGGLRLIITGGEPLLYSHFTQLNQFIQDKTAYRKILVTNGIYLSTVLAESLNFDEVQVSLDGLERGHDILRGKGSFKKTMVGLSVLAEKSMPFSIATVLHRHNLSEILGLFELVKNLGAISWTVDFPVLAGNLSLNSELIPTFEEAIPYMSLSFGAEVHCSEGDYLCGSHLGCIKAGGNFTKCGFYDSISGGNVEDGLTTCWERLPKLRLEDLNCKCDFLDKCKGGCRYRAESMGDRWGPDPLKCLQFEFEKQKI